MSGDSVRKKALQDAMVVAGLSVRELTQKSGFLLHQVKEAIQGTAKVSPYVYSSLLRIINDHSAKKRME